MKRLCIFLAATLFAAPACRAESVFSCTTESGMSFQSMPCIVLAANDLVLPSAKAEARADEDAPVTASPGATPPDLASVHSRRDELQAGMSDLQVLNNRRWGKPQRITRNREVSAWHEYWDYRTGANGGKQLHFVNGLLAGIADLVQPAPTASLTPAALMVGR